MPHRVVVSILAFVLAACGSSPPTPPPDAGGSTDVVDAPAPGDPVQVLVWSGRTLPPRIERTARTLEGVVAVGERRSGIVNLRRVSGGRSLPPRPRDAVVPVSVTSVDDEVLASFPDMKDIAESLAAGRAVVPASSAEFRGVEAGDTIVLANRGRAVELTIGLVASDSQLLRAEFVLPVRTARRLGLEGGNALVMAAEPEVALATERAIQRTLDGFPARVRSGMSSPSVPGRQLSTLEVKQLFGEFWFRPLSGIAIEIDPSWVRRNIVYRRVPVLGVVRCHRAIIPQLRAAMQELKDRGLDHHIRTVNGCYNPRMQSFNAIALSRHAFGVAFDINAATNGYGRRPTLDARVVDVVERWGFVWGGRWTIPDGMHFEVVRLIDPTT